MSSLFRGLPWDCVQTHHELLQTPVCPSWCRSLRFSSEDQRASTSPLPPSSSLEPVNDRAGEFALTPPTFITLPIISVYNKHLGRGVATSLTPISLKPQSRSDIPPITVNPAAPRRATGRAVALSDLCFKLSGTQTRGCDRLISINYLN